MNKLKETIILALLFVMSTSSYAQLSQEKWSEIITKKEPAWFATREAYDVAENVLLYQRNIGGWPKNIEMHAPLTNQDKQKLIELKSDTKEITTDNKATTQEMLFLSKMYAQTNDERYSKSFLAGLDYLLEAQYENGGWPQFYPLKKGYYTHITYNDDSMVNTLNVLKNCIENTNVYSIKPPQATLDKAKIAFDKGIDCILKTQYKQGETLTGWCQQHDEVTLLPAKARAYELPSLSGKESAKIVLLLMSIKEPTPEIINAVNSAYNWFEKTKINSLKEIRIIGEDGKISDKVMIDDPANGMPIWARFMDLETSKPFFCDRDGIKKDKLSDIGQERRAGYSWYSNQPKEVLKKYSKWSRKYNK
ncbi:pectate lyase [Flavobacterium limnophilum]|uniref:pectate lyase n=1 Tax=Flavobacterium limnophilum TaxID=3003262 RepID=UPI0022ABD2C3|nr:pectate lyase [Flavobacterium limnophilum]